MAGAVFSNRFLLPRSKLTPTRSPSNTQVELKEVMVELVEARESLERKDTEIDSLQTSKGEIEERLSALDQQLQDQKLVAAQPTVVEVIKEVSAAKVTHIFTTSRRTLEFYESIV